MQKQKRKNNISTMKTHQMPNKLQAVSNLYQCVNSKPKLAK